MERMGAPLDDVVPSLKAQRRKAGGKVAFGPIAVALLDCVQAIHLGRHLFVDVKPENFMLAPKGKNLADRIRMIDLGLFWPLHVRDYTRANSLPMVRMLSSLVLPSTPLSTFTTAMHSVGGMIWRLSDTSLQNYSLALSERKVVFLGVRGRRMNTFSR